MLKQIEAKALYSSDGFYQISEIVRTLSETPLIDLKRLFYLGRDSTPDHAGATSDRAGSAATGYRPYLELMRFDEI